MCEVRSVGTSDVCVLSLSLSLPLSLSLSLSLCMRASFWFVCVRTYSDLRGHFLKKMSGNGLEKK